MASSGPAASRNSPSTRSVSRVMAPPFPFTLARRSSRGMASSPSHTSASQRSRTTSMGPGGSRRVTRTLGLGEGCSATSELREDGLDGLEGVPDVLHGAGVGEPQVPFPAGPERGSRQDGHAGVLQDVVGDLLRGPPY